MKRKYIKIISIALWVMSAILILSWYDWKLLIILMVFGWANNIMMKLNNSQRQ